MNTEPNEAARRVLLSPDGLKAMSLYFAAGYLRSMTKGDEELFDLLDKLKPPNGGDDTRRFSASVLRRADELESEAKELMERAGRAAVTP